MRADFVPFGDGVVIDPARRVAVTYHRGSRRSSLESTAQSRGWTVMDPKTSRALVFQGVGLPGRWSSRALVFQGVGLPGRWSSRALVFQGVGRPGRRTIAGVGQSQASDDRRRRAITASGKHSVGQSPVRVKCSRSSVAPIDSQYGPNGVGFGANETPSFKGVWGSSIETG